jgi:arylsulfatase
MAGVIEPGRKSSQIISHLDWFATFMSALGDPGMKDKDAGRATVW